MRCESPGLVWSIQAVAAFFLNLQSILVITGLNSRLESIQQQSLDCQMRPHVGGRQAGCGPSARELWAGHLPCSNVTPQTWRCSLLCMQGVWLPPEAHPEVGL